MATDLRHTHKHTTYAQDIRCVLSNLTDVKKSLRKLNVSGLVSSLAFIDRTVINADLNRPASIPIPSWTLLDRSRRQK